MCNAKRDFLACGGADVLKIREDALRGLGAKEGYGGVLFHGAHEGLEHKVELARLRELANRAAVRARIVLDVVCALATMAAAAFDERIRESSDVATRLPDQRALDDGAVQSNDVIAFLHHLAPPRVTHVSFELHAQRAVVPRGADAAVDLAGGEHESAPLGKRDDRVHVFERGLNGHVRFLLIWETVTGRGLAPCGEPWL